MASVQEESELTSRSMTEASGEVAKATEFIRKVGDTLVIIETGVRKVSDQIIQIATAVEEQSATSTEVTSNIEKTSSIAGETEQRASEMAREINGLITVADELRQSVSHFTITNG
jgi:methyl-accepting chemotaxis protein